MKLIEAVKTLAEAGTAQNRKVYARHGIREPMYGCSFAHLKSVAKRIKHDQKLAEQLWDTGNHDCRCLAIMVADPQAIKKSTLAKWGRGVDNGCLSGMLGDLAANTDHAFHFAGAWCESSHEFTSAAGWSAVAVLAMTDDDHGELNELLATCLEAIEQGIHAAPNHTKQAMNGALIAIGGRNAKLKKLALSAAKRIGKVEVDHGETNCKTPDAAGYIAKMWARKDGSKRSSAH